MIAMRLAALAALTALATASAGLASTVTPMFQTFGDLPEATFGGSGIPTNPTAFSRFTIVEEDQSVTTLTLGLSATQRFFNPAPGNDANGTYFATAGSNNGGAGNPSSIAAALWNFNFYIDVSGTAGRTIDDFDVMLSYDVDPSTGTDFGAFDFAGVPVGTLQGSQNLAFGYLTGSAAIPNLTPPAGAFDPLAAGQYSFVLNSTVGQVAINVDVAAIPLPASALLLIAGLGGLGVAARRRTHARPA